MDGLWKPDPPTPPLCVPTHLSPPRSTLLSAPPHTHTPTLPPASPTTITTTYPPTNATTNVERVQRDAPAAHPSPPTPHPPPTHQLLQLESRAHAALQSSAVLNSPTYRPAIVMPQSSFCSTGFTTCPQRQEVSRAHARARARTRAPRCSISPLPQPHDAPCHCLLQHNQAHLSQPLKLSLPEDVRTLCAEGARQRQGAWARGFLPRPPARGGLPASRHRAGPTRLYPTPPA